MEKDYIEFAIDYTHNHYSCRHHNPQSYPYALQTITPIKFGGFYAGKIDRIRDNLYTTSKREIIQILARKSLNAMQLKKILGYSYPTIYKHLKTFESLRLITLSESRSEKGKKEMKIKINENATFTPLTPKDESFIVLIKSIMADSESGLKEFDENLGKDIERALKKPTSRLASVKKKQRY